MKFGNHDSVRTNPTAKFQKIIESVICSRRELLSVCNKPKLATTSERQATPQTAVTQSFAFIMGGYRMLPHSLM